MAIKYQNIEPHWCNMFENAIWQVKVMIQKTDGQDMIVEMLKYGKRIHQANYCIDGCEIDKQ